MEDDIVEMLVNPKKLVAVAGLETVIIAISKLKEPFSLVHYIKEIPYIEDWPYYVRKRPLLHEHQDPAVVEYIMNSATLQLHENDFDCLPKLFAVVCKTRNINLVKRFFELYEAKSFYTGMHRAYFYSHIQKQFELHDVFKLTMENRFYLGFMYICKRNDQIEDMDESCWEYTSSIQYILNGERLVCAGQQQRIFQELVIVINKGFCLVPSPAKTRYLNIWQETVQTGIYLFQLQQMHGLPIECIILILQYFSPLGVSMYLQHRTDKKGIVVSCNKVLSLRDKT